MSRLIEWCIRLLCAPGRHEELLGDLAELHARRDGRAWVDTISMALHQSRARDWGPHQWSVAALVTAAAVAVIGAAPIAASRPLSYAFDGRDAAGVFTLEVRDRKVLAASMDGLPFPLSRISTIGNTITFHTDDPTHALKIDLVEDGTIQWQGRDGTDPTQDTPIPLEWVRQYFAEVEAAGAADGGALWGKDLRGPLMFVDRATRFIAANAPDSAQMLTDQGGVWTGTLPEDQSIANTAFEWAGRRWTMVAWPVPSDRYARQQLLFHESFHRLQPALNLPASDPANDHLATRDGRIWLRLEWRALAEALLRGGADRRTAIEDALAFRARRRSLVPGAAATENALELNEGIAEYTGLVMSGLPGSVLADRAAIALSRRDLQDSFVRSFAYASGPAYGLLLDAVEDNWRINVTATSDLGAMLADAHGLRVRHAGAESRVAAYDGTRVIAQEQDRADQEAAVQAELRTRFLESPTLTVAPGASFRYSFNPNGANPLQGIGTVYDAARITDEWGILDVTSGGVLLVRDDRFITAVVVPVTGAADGAPMTGDGWVLDLADGWELVPGEGERSWRVQRREPQ